METISSLFEISQRFLRSTNIERDFADPKALDNYILTDHAAECLSRLAVGMQPTSTQRAWRVTGTYGSGKSSFALLLAHWFRGDAARLSKALSLDLTYQRFALTKRPEYLPLLVTGSREPMGRAILKALARLFTEQYQRGIWSHLHQRIETVSAARQVSDQSVIDLLLLANAKLIKDEKSSGLLILVDELGKFLEHAALHPESQDVYLLQRLAEAAATSGKEAPLYLVGFLHQGFDAYASTLDPAAQHEWEKIAGRFDEILFNQPLLQIFRLIGSALRVRTSALPRFAKQEARDGVDTALRLGWFGSGVTTNESRDLGQSIYPIHGMVLPVLVRAFSRFGQNERSLFSFLLSEEPFSLVTFSSRAVEPGNTYRLPNLYDYIRSNFGHRLSLHSYRSHWPQIESMVESFSTADPLELLVVKTVGLLNLLDDSELLPTDEALVGALGGPGGRTESEIRTTIHKLTKRRVLFRRRAAGTLCLWPHTSVDLEWAYENAKRTIGAVTSVGNHLAEFLETRPIVARRHYIQTGNFRYFEVRCSQVAEIERILNEPTNADGRVLIVLCETAADCAQASKLSQSESLRGRRNILLAVPKEPLAHQAMLVSEVLRWNWVASNTPELNGDRYAREEVSRRKAEAKQLLESRVQDLIGLGSLRGAVGLNWFCDGKKQAIENGRQLLECISTQCDEIYSKAPLIRNELVNRRMLSSAAAAARMRLIERVLSESKNALLGMDGEKTPPEMSIYFSIFRRGRIHVETEQGHQLRIPLPKEDVLQIGPSLRAIRTFLEGHGDRRVRVAEIFEHLAAPPYGVHSGVAPILLAIYTAINSQELAFYETDTFLREIGGKEFLRLCKNPQAFDVQICRVAGVRGDVFESLLRVLEITPGETKETRVLDVIRPLCTFVAELPDYARQTQRLSDKSREVRRVILGARDPVKLLFHDLPLACGFVPFSTDGGCSKKNALEFAQTLKLQLDELRAAFDGLLSRMRGLVKDNFDLGGDFREARTQLATRAERVVLLATEPKIKALCLRLCDRGIADDSWLESLGSLLALQPPNHWHDSSEDAFAQEIGSLCDRFKNLESIAFSPNVPNDFAEAFKLSLTRSDGMEAAEVVFIDPKQASEVDALACKIAELISEDRKSGVAALSRVVWNTLNRS